jgi:hypothetical protein
MSFFSVLKAFFNPAFICSEYLTFWGGGKGGGGGGSQQSTSYSTNLPEYARPYYQELLKQTGKNIFTTDDKGFVTGVKGAGELPLQTRIGLTDAQRAAMAGIAGLQTPGQFAQATQGLGLGQGMGFGAAAQGLGQAFNYNPQAVNARNVQAALAPGARMQAAQSSYNPNLQTFQMSGPQNVQAMGVGTQNFGQGAADFYMSPYQQAVTDMALREAQQQGQLQKQAGAMGAIGRGTFGGARQALLQAEGDRNLMRTMGDIQAQGSQQAFQNAQQQFQADQARQLQAQLANQQAGLTAQQANQQAGLTVGQQNLASQLATQQLGAGIGKDISLANLSNAQQANVQNLAAQLQTQGLNADQAMRAALANQQAGLTADQLTQQGQQFAAGLGKDIGLAGLSAGIDTSKALGAMGTEQQTAELNRLQAQIAAGDKEQAQKQGESDTDYQNRMAKLNYEKQQLQFYSDILRGNAGALGSTAVQYSPAPSMASQVGGLGIAGLGLAKALG